LVKLLTGYIFRSSNDLNDWNDWNALNEKFDPKVSVKQT
jgi:hypothetical protein